MACPAPSPLLGWRGTWAFLEPQTQLQEHVGVRRRSYWAENPTSGPAGAAAPPLSLCSGPPLLLGQQLFPAYLVPFSSSCRARPGGVWPPVQMPCPPPVVQMQPGLQPAGPRCRPCWDFSQSVCFGAILRRAGVARRALYSQRVARQPPAFLCCSRQNRRTVNPLMKREALFAFRAFGAPLPHLTQQLLCFLVEQR